MGGMEEQVTRDFQDFDVVPVTDDHNEEPVSRYIRLMHHRAAECAENLTVDAWEGEQPQKSTIVFLI